MKLALLAAGLASVIAIQAQDLVVFHNPAEAPQSQLTAYLNGIGKKELSARGAELAGLKTRADAERRQQAVREKVLRLIGGLPTVHGPLHARSAGVLKHDDYRVEKIIYESLPGFYVTANVYVPAQGTGPYPAVLMPIGHWEGGKEGDRLIAVGLARKGFVALEYDPIGQGERIQYYDPDTRASKVGSSTTEHSHANLQTLAIGDSVARYRIWDGIRGIDYLVSRKDVDPQRIGCMGCSGGGTLTTYISALDRRVKVAVPACYINSWLALLEGPGPQDGEQVFPHFLSEGLDIADFIELFAPKPWLIESTKEDFFPLEGARQAYEDAKRFYTLFGAEDHLQWFVGPGGHGVPQVSREALYAFFIKWLGNGKGDPAEVPAKLDNPQDILCTSTGQVADSLGSESVYSLNKKRAIEVLAPHPNVPAARLAADIRALTGITIAPGGDAPAVTVLRSLDRDGYKLDVVSYESEPGITIPGVILAPEATGAKPAVLVVDAPSKQRLPDLEDLARAGNVVFAILPRGVQETPPPPRRNEILGDYSDSTRAYVVGKTLVGMRAEDIFRAMDYLVSRPDVDRGKITGFGVGSLGVPLAHAAVLDRRIAGLVLDRTLVSYRMAVDHPVNYGLYDVLVPGVLRKYDIDDLLAALSPRPVTLVDPADQLGKPLRLPHKWPSNVKRTERAPDDPLHQFLPNHGRSD
jgi:cephalosporin-C deacetylase-like acetyl esterase